MEASFYTSETAQTHGTAYCAFYMGRNSVWREEATAPRSMFKSEKDWTEYLAGRREAQAEVRLDADTEWDTDE